MNIYCAVFNPGVFKKIVLISATVLLLLNISCKNNENPALKIGLVVTPETVNSMETTSQLNFLAQNDIAGAEFLYPEVIPADKQFPANLDIVWIHHKTGSQLPESFTKQSFISLLDKYIQEGGKVMLSMDALRILPFLGLENKTPDTLTVGAFDQGYGRQLGLHAYLNHPLFDGMHGGAYLFHPENDTTTIQTGYFESGFIPDGKVIAVDWSYITFHEDKKLVLEYSKGEGRVLAIGAYMDFAMKNKNADQLARFIKNAITYLKNPLPERLNYWNYHFGEVKKFKAVLPELKLPEVKKWELYPGKLSYFVDSAGSDFWDLGGMRMLVMGKEQAGIDEIWAHPFMALRDYQVAIENTEDKSFTWLEELTPSVSILPEAIVRTYRLEEGLLKEIIAVHHTQPIAVIHYEYEGEPARLLVRFTSNLRLMWPYSQKVTGSLKYCWNQEFNAFVVTDEAGNFRAITGFNIKPDMTDAGRYSAFITENGTINPISTDLYQMSGLAVFDLNLHPDLDVIISASQHEDQELTAQYQRALNNPYSVYQNARDYYQMLTSNKLMINTPDEALDLGYRWALTGADRHFTNTPGIGSSLIAGIGTTARGWNGRHEISGRPGYAWYFGRDGQWSGFAINDYGDTDKVRDILSLFIKYQALNGKIFHELTTSGTVHYDAADATPLFLVLAGKYLRATGDLDFIRQNMESINKALEFCFSTDSDGDGLIENINVGHGWVEGGFLFGGKTTIYLASCWAAALEECAYIFRSAGKTDLADKYLINSNIVKEKIRNEFYNQEQGFYNHSLKKDNTFITENTIMPAVPVYFGHIPQERSETSLNNWASNNFTSGWGVRIVGEDNQRFHPAGYHTGSVWPLYTGWVALAEYANHRSASAFAHIMSTIRIKDFWAKGFTEEVMHGATFRPIGVCAHQCWSETMILQPLIEGLTGYRPDAMNNILEISPKVPAGWDSYEFENMTLAKQKVNLSMKRSRDKYLFTFSSSGKKPINILFRPLLPAGTTIIAANLNGKAEDIEITTVKDGIMPTISFLLNHPSNLEFTISGGIAVLPILQYPQPGDSSSGLRLISSGFNENIYTIGLEAPAGTTHEIGLYVNYPEIKITENADLLNFDGNIATIKVIFEGDEKYVRKTVHITI